MIVDTSLCIYNIVIKKIKKITQCKKILRGPKARYDF